MGKDPLLLCCTYISSSNTSSLLLLHLQYHQRSESMVLKMSVKSKFVLWQPRCYNLLTEKKGKENSRFWRTHFFGKRTVTVLMKFSSNTIFRWYTFGKFYIVKFNYFRWRHSNVNQRFFNILDWPLSWWYWKWQYRLQVLKISCISVPVPGESVHPGWYIYNSFVHIIYVLFICM